MLSLLGLLGLAGVAEGQACGAPQRGRARLIGQSVPLVVITNIRVMMSTQFYLRGPEVMTAILIRRNNNNSNKNNNNNNKHC
jgi:hypothetical protein